FVLSHRRVGDLSDGVDAKERQRVAHALERRLARHGAVAEVEPVGDRSYRIDYVLPAEAPAVSVIVPTTAKRQILGPCVDGLLRRTDYPDLEVLLVVNRSADRTYLDELAGRGHVRVLTHNDDGFNFSRLNFQAVEQAQ